MEINAVTQSIAANSEESASASEELSSQALVLESLVEKLIVLVEGTAGLGKAPVPGDEETLLLPE